MMRHWLRCQIDLEVNDEDDISRTFIGSTFIDEVIALRRLEATAVASSVKNDILMDCLKIFNKLFVSIYMILLLSKHIVWRQYN